MMRIFIRYFIFLLVLSTAGCLSVLSKRQCLRPGLLRDSLFAGYGKSDERTYRIKDNEEWITFDAEGGNKVITFHLRDKAVVGWEFDNRSEVVSEYLSEFCSQSFAASFPIIYQAIEKVMIRLPWDVFLKLTERQYPVLFTEYHYTGLGRLANSGDIRFMPDDPPTFTKGFYLVKLSAELQTVEVDVIEAIVAHELAHRFLGHGGCGNYTAEMERAANRLIKEWGFEKEFKKAQERF